MTRWLDQLTLERGVVVGSFLVILGFVLSLTAVGVWGERSFGALDPSRTLRLIIPAVVSLTLGCQIILSSFFLSVLRLRRR